MKKNPGFLSHLQKSFEDMHLSDLKRLSRFGGLEISELIDQILNPSDHTVCDPESILELDEVSSRDVIPLDFKVLKYSFSDVPFIREKDEEFSPFETVLLTPDYKICSPVQFVPCGSGDIMAVLLEGGALDKWRREGFKHVYLSSGEVDEGLVGEHLASGSPVTCKVKAASPGDEVLLCRHQGVEQLVSSFRVSYEDPCIDPSNELKWAWTGSAVVDLRVDLTKVRWKWHKRPKILGQSTAWCFQRSFEDLTSAYKTRFVR